MTRHRAAVGLPAPGVQRTAQQLTDATKAQRIDLFGLNRAFPRRLGSKALEHAAAESFAAVGRELAQIRTQAAAGDEVHAMAARAEAGVDASPLGNAGGRVDRRRQRTGRNKPGAVADRWRSPGYCSDAAAPPGK